MKSFMILIGFAFICSGCAQDPNIACRSYGYAVGSSEFARCTQQMYAQQAAYFQAGAQMLSQPQNTSQTTNCYKTATGVTCHDF